VSRLLSKRRKIKPGNMLSERCKKPSFTLGPDKNNEVIKKKKVRREERDA